MNCLNFPKMFRGNSTLVDTYEDYIRGDEYNKNPTSVCLDLLLKSERRGMFGDPEFGIRLKYYTFNQNNYVLKDILVDEIYNQITTFCPQIGIDRKDIVVSMQEKGKLHIKIQYINKLDFTTDMYNLVLRMEGEE